MKDRIPCAKIVLYGKEGAGKSALMMRYMYDRFDSETGSTIGAAFSTKKVMVGSIPLHLQIWDTAGSERFNAIAPMYVRGAQVILLCFQEQDVKDIESRLRRISDIIEGTEIILVATKLDLSRDRSYEDIDRYAKQHNYQLFYTSSATGFGVATLFQEAAKVGLEKVKDKIPVTKSFIVPPQETNKGCCWS